MSTVQSSAAQLQERSELRIHRTTQSAHFTIIPNALIRDQALSHAARGCLIEILSNREDWKVTADGMWRGAGTREGEGRNVYRRWFQEIEAAGYLTRIVVTSPGPRGGVKIATVLHFYDTPVPAGQRTSSTSPQVSPTTGSPGVGHPVVGSPGVIKKDQGTRTNSEQSSSGQSHAGDDDQPPSSDSGKGRPGSAGAGRDSRGEKDALQDLAVRLQEVLKDDYDFQPRFLGPRFRKVGRDMNVSAALLDQVVVWWLRDDAADSGFRSFTGLLHHDEDDKRPNPAGYLYKALPDLVTAYLEARDKKAAELGVEGGTFNLCGWLTDQEDAAA